MSKDCFKVTLVPGSYNDDPVKMIWMIWEQSRCDDSIDTLEKRYEFLFRAYRDNPTMSERGIKAFGERKGFKFPVDAVNPSDRFRLLLQMDVPIIEMIKFTFVLENIPVSFREHLVRHRIGSKIGPNSGVDDEPGIPDVTYWSQTSRVRDLQNFFDVGNFYTPEILDDTEAKPVSPSPDPCIDLRGNFTDKSVYDLTLRWIQWGYRELRARGYKPEVSREVLPSCTTHRIAWSVNLKSLKHIFGHRSCFIAYAGYWHPVIHGVIRELITKVNSVFHALATPPCIDKKSNKFKGCVFEHENKHRLDGNDPGVPCSLWLSNHTSETRKYVSTASENDLDEFDRMKKEYSTFWGRDPETGDSLG